MTRLLLLGQGAYFAIAGIWPVLHMRSFEAVTGPKTDRWLVRTVGSLLVVIGVVLALASRQERPRFEVGLLAAGSALVLAAIDTVYSLRGRISKIYLADGVVEVLLALALMLTWPRKNPSNA